MIRKLRTTMGATLCVAIGLISSQPAGAHDFFLLSSEGAPGGSGMTLKATIGSHFPKPEIAIAADRVDSLTARGRGTPGLSVVRADPDGLTLRVDGAKPGTLVASARMKAREIDYAEDRIPLILAEYRIAPAALSQIELMVRPRTLRVVSRRLAKAIACIDRCDGLGLAVVPNGDRLEFVAAKGAGTRYRLLFNGRPLGDYPVDIVSADGKRSELRTDTGGEVAGPQQGSGPHMLFAAHMTPPETGDRYTLDLTSLTVPSR